MKHRPVGLNSLDVLFCILALSYGLVQQTPKAVFGKDDPLFGCIESQQGAASFGHLLDAGTGLYSLRWMASLCISSKLESFTAVTAEDRMRHQVTQLAQELGVLDDDSKNVIIKGNWFGDLPLDRPQYDTILAEYLIGAMDAFAPFQQQEIIPKLVDILKPGGKLYLVGWEPIPDKLQGTADILCQVRRIRDACILLAGERCYREYPLEWVLRQVDRTPSVQLGGVHKFPIRYRHQKIMGLLNAGRLSLPRFPSNALAKSMEDVLDDLERRSKEATDASPTGTIEQGFDYLVTILKD